MKAVIAGAGPAGALTAIFLAQQGYSVNVYEKRSCPEAMPPPGDNKAYLLNLNTRAFAAFKAAGVSPDVLVKRCNGRSEFTFRDGKGRQLAGVNSEVTIENPTMIRVYRDEISRHLIDEGKRLHSEAISFHFESPITSVDFEKRVAQISGTQEVQYDLLVGADGAGSAVRVELQKVMPPEYIKRRSHTAVYATGPLELTDPDQLPKHTYTTMDSFEARSAPMLLSSALEGAIMVYGRGNGDNRLGFFLDAAGAEKLRQGDDAWLQKYLDDSMPKLISDARQAAKKLAANPPSFSPISGWTSLSQLHGPRVVLLGDAAHTMTPVTGQGCNSGLEDAHIFADVLREEDDLDKALPRYNEKRLPDVAALVRLNEILAFGRFGVLIDTAGGAILHKIWLLSHSAIMSTQMARMSLHRAAPKVFGMPPLYQALFGTAPFRKVMPAAYFDTALLAVFGSAIAGAAYYAARRK